MPCMEQWFEKTSKKQEQNQEQGISQTEDLGVQIAGFFRGLSRKSNLRNLIYQGNQIRQREVNPMKFHFADCQYFLI